MPKKKQVVEFTQSNVMLVLKLYFYKSKYKAYCTKNTTTNCAQLTPKCICEQKLIAKIVDFSECLTIIIIVK